MSLWHLNRFASPLSRSSDESCPAASPAAVLAPFLLGAAGAIALFPLAAGSAGSDLTHYVTSCDLTGDRSATAGRRRRRPPMRVGRGHSRQRLQLAGDPRSEGVAREAARHHPWQMSRREGGRRRREGRRQREVGEEERGEEVSLTSRAHLSNGPSQRFYPAQPPHIQNHSAKLEKGAK
jgi:hypothetical protein